MAPRASQIICDQHASIAAVLRSLAMMIRSARARRRVPGRFEQAARDYVHFYLQPMQIEEAQLLPVALRLLTPADWAELDAAFLADPDPLGAGAGDPVFQRLFTRIVLTAPAPIGVGRGLRDAAPSTA